MTASSGFLLIVDDEEFNRDMLLRRLEIEGFTGLAVESGAEALALLERHDFDAVLLDVMMPVQSGYDVLRIIRQTRSPIELPVLMVTAKNQSEDMVNAFEVGANDYITKPINFPVTIARLNSHIASRRMSSQLRASEERYSLSAQGANDGLWDWDLVSDRIHYSERWKSMLGFDPSEISDTPSEWFGRVHPDDLPHVHKAIAAHRSGSAAQFECEFRILHCDQSYRWVLTRGLAVRDASGRVTRMAGSQSDITRGKAADPLTGLPNRVLFMDHLTSTANRRRTSGADHFAVLFLDLDRFKIVNDSLGHIAGDELLVAVARRLEACLRSTDVVSRTGDRSTVSRFGGDEFVILVSGLAEPSNATLVADRIQSMLNEPLSLHGHEVSISASIGIAVSTAESQTADDMLRDADTAMYQAKAAGKSRWCLFDQSMRKQAVERLAVEEDLRRSIERKELKVHYQPIVELPSRRILGMEALLRWVHPTRGVVSPADFIPIAEEIGFIVEMGTWVLEEACRQTRTWQLEYPAHESMFVSVNVSTKQFEPTLIDRVKDCLKRTGLSPQCLKLEITESAIMTEPKAAESILNRLREMGVQVSLDDFGTGYSSLSYLQNFKIDTLKIDRSFIARLGGVDGSDEIVRTIVNLAHNLGMQVTAEGIEDAAQHSRLRALSCECGQGYLYSRPVPEESMETLLRSGWADEDELSLPERPEVRVTAAPRSATASTLGS